MERQVLVSVKFIHTYNGNNVASGLKFTAVLLFLIKHELFKRKLLFSPIYRVEESF